MVSSYKKRSISTSKMLDENNNINNASISNENARYSGLYDKTVRQVLLKIEIIKINYLNSFEELGLDKTKELCRH